MSFTFNKETRRSLRERIRDGVNLIPGASTVVQASGSILNSATGAVGVGGGEKKSIPTPPGNFQKKSHSVDSTSLIQLQEPEESILTGTAARPPQQQQQPPISPSYLSAENNPIAGDQHDTPSRSGSVSSCSSSTSSSPSKYRTYVVKPNDTVTSIAAQMDCTPSELMRVNRLITARVLFPGQVLKIPNKRSDNKPLQNQQTSAPTDAPSQPTTDPATATILESITYAQRKFLKVKVRHVTDGNGVVSGTLLITPNAVMFDPNVSDPLVIEQGAETYGVIVPIEFIVGASIWSDICGMRVRGKEAFIAPGPRPILWGAEKEEARKEKLVEKSESESAEEKPGNEGEEKKEEEKSIDDTEPMKTDEESASTNRLEEVTDHPLMKEPENVVSTWYFCLTIGRPKPSEDHANDQKHARRNPYCVTYGQKNNVRPEFWFSVGVEQVPELFKYWMFWWPHLYGEVNPATVSERGYELVDWDNLDVSLDGNVGAGSGRSHTDGGGEEQTVAQELNELTKESWEMLKQPYAKLSSFITTRGSSIMKSSSHSSQSSVSDALVGQQHSASSTHHHHAHQSTSSSLFNSHHFSITNPMNSFFFESFSNISPNHSVFDDTDDDDDEFGSFEQVVTSEELRNLLAMGGEEMMALNLPELIGGKSEILEEEDVRNITRHLTARAEGYPWTLIFTSSRDGFSLNSLYRRNSLMQEDSPVMLIVQDTNSRVFGALVSCSLHTSDSFYGTGQSFLFTLRPEFNIYKWTGENLFFVKGNHDGIWIGAGDGKFGLYVDGDLNCGRTETCQTYGNPPLTEPQDFIIKTLECWAFGNYVLSTGNDLIDRVSASDK